MIKWSHFPFLRILLAFIAGILLAMVFGSPGNGLLYVWLLILAAFVGLQFLAKRKQSAFLFSVAGMLALLAFGLAGWLLTGLRTEKNQPQHLLQKTGEVTHYIGKLNDFLLEKPAVFQTALQLKQVKINGKWQAATGQVQVSFRRDSTLQKPRYGDVLLVKGSPKLVASPLNPGQFDYRKYLAARNIHHQHYLYPEQFQVLGQQISNPVKAFSITLRRNLDQVFKKYISTHREYSIATALVLGVKDELDNELKAAYSNTGTMHILAVSGLHVGLVIVVITFLLKPFRRNYTQRILSVMVVLGVVWVYAFVTALSPSVLRAAVMFSIVAGAQILQKRSNMYNTLAVAAFVLLCFSPFYLLDVGFQLSFLAVLAIVYLQPRIYKLWQPENRAADKLWQLTSVSLAAQIGTFPLGLYYFHQFPVYFLVSNLFAVPLATVVLYNGLAVVFFFWIPGLNIALTKLMQGLLWLLNESMLWLEKWPGAVINRIPFSGLETVLIYLFIFVLLIFLARRKLSYFAAACGLLVLFSGSQVKNAFAGNRNPKLIIHAVPRQSVWSFLAENATVLADSAFLQNKQAQSFTIEPILLTSGIKNVEFQPINEVQENRLAQIKTPEGKLVSWRGLKILVLEKAVAQNLQKPVTIDLLIIRNNAPVSVEKLRRNFRFQQLVFDSSNQSRYVKKLSKELQAAGIPFHDVSTQGAFVKQL